MIRIYKVINNKAIDKIIIFKIFNHAIILMSKYKLNRYQIKKSFHKYNKMIFKIKNLIMIAYSVKKILRLKILLLTQTIYYKEVKEIKNYDIIIYRFLYFYI